MKTKVAYHSEDDLGEGPVWSVAEQAIYWVDIHGPTLQRLQPETGKIDAWVMPSYIGCYALREAGDVVVGLRDGLYTFDLDSQELTNLCRPEVGLNTRFNDGKCDRNGRFWAGTMDLGFADPLGSLYRLDADGRCHQMRSGVTCSNGLGWSPDNRTMYYTDTPTRSIFAYDFELETGALQNERVFAKVDDGLPDGLTVDAEGYIWSAKWDGWRVVRYAPDGSIEREINLPVQRPTSCTFGGPKMNLLYITSARTGLSAVDLAEQPLAGSLLVLDTAVQGLPEPLYAG